MWFHLFTDIYLFRKFETTWYFSHMIHVTWLRIFEYDPATTSKAFPKWKIPIPFVLSLIFKFSFVFLSTTFIIEGSSGCHCIVSDGASLKSVLYRASADGQNEPLLYCGKAFLVNWNDMAFPRIKSNSLTYQKNDNNRELLSCLLEFSQRSPFLRILDCYCSLNQTSGLCGLFMEPRWNWDITYQDI